LKEVRKAESDEKSRRVELEQRLSEKKGADNEGKLQNEVVKYKVKVRELEDKLKELQSEFKTKFSLTANQH
jgi:hypothetical protein